MASEQPDSLLHFVSSVAGDELLKVEENLGDGFVRLRVSEAERRQAKHDIRCVEDAVIELLRNSRDAGARRIFLASAKEGHLRTLCCIDDAEGIPPQLHDLIFEPRVTSKLETMTMDAYGVHGRGMALYSLKTNLEMMRVAWSGPRRGTAMLAVADTRHLAERKDQSTWPEIDGSGTTPAVTKGPHNILRTTVEFALSAQDIDVYVGAPADILATMRALAAREQSLEHLFAASRADDLEVWHFAASAADAQRLSDLAADIYGLHVSARNAQRILSEEITPLAHIIDALGARPSPQEPAPKRIDLAKDRRSVRIEQDDLDALASATADAFKLVAGKYYLEADPQPEINATSDEIRIRLNLRKLE